MNRHTSTANADGQRRVGLVAGWGRYPIVVAKSLRAQGYQIHCLAVAGHADESLAALCHDYRTLGLGKMGTAIRHFRRHGIRRATMAGKVFKIPLLDPRYFWGAIPDWRTLRTFAPHFLFHRRDRRDDTLLGCIVNEFARDGIAFEPATDLLPELLVRQGQLTTRGPTAAQWKDIAFGWQMAKEMGRLDIGQSVAVKGRATVAVEAIEGTDACIARAGALCPAGGFTLVKVAKPQQDMRFDVPTIGPGTIEALVKAGGSVLAIESGRTIILDEEEVICRANEHRLTIVALDDAAIASQGR